MRSTMTRSTGLSRNKFQPPIAVISARHLIPSGFQSLLEQVDNLRIVVDDKDASRDFRHRPTPAHPAFGE